LPVIYALYVDAEPEVLREVRAFFEREGDVSVETCSTAEEAYSILKTRTYDAIISEVRLPAMSGIGFLKMLRSEGDDTLFVVFTGTGSEKTAMDALNEGANGYLTKDGELRTRLPELEALLFTLVRRRQHDDAHKAAGALCREVIEDQTELICRFGPDGRHLFVNEAYCSYFGKDRNDIIGHRFVPDIPAEEVSMVRSHLASLSPENPVRSSEHRIMPDGTMRWERWNDRAIFDGNGQIVEYQSVGRDITRQKQIEQEILTREQQLRNIMQNLPIGIYRNTAGADGRFIMANPFLAEMHGYDSLDEFMACRVADLYADASQREAFCARLREKGIIRNAELLMNRKQGDQFWANISAIGVTGPSGELEFIDGITEDITGYKQAQAALYESEARFRLLAETSTDMISQHDREGTYLYVSPVCQALTGYAPEDLIGHPASEFIYPDDKQIAGQWLARLVEGPATACIEYRIMRKDGNCIWFESTVRSIERDGVVTEIHVASRDVTARKLADKALKKSENLYRTIFENTGTAMLISENDMTISLANSECERLTGYVREDIVGMMKLTDFVEPSDLDRVMSYHTFRRNKRDLAPTHYELRIKSRTGGIRDIYVTVAMIPGTDRSMVSLMDITERKLLERELEQHNAKIGRYARELSIINQIIGNTAASLTLAEFLPFSCRKTLELLNFNAGGIYLIHPGTDRADLMCLYTLPLSCAGDIQSLPVATPPYDAVFVGGEPLYDGQLSGLFPDAMESGIFPAAMVPLKAEDQVIGAMLIADTGREHVFAPDEKALLSSIGQELGRTVMKKRMQDELEDAYRKANLYLDIMTHDINNVNTAALAYATFLEDMVGEPEKAYLSRVLSTIRQSINIIRNVSTIRRLHEQQISLYPVSLDEVIEKEIEHAGRERISYRPSSCYVSADDLVGEVFSNLLGNSRKFGGRKAEIAISVHDYDGEVEVSVEDTGPGIPEDLKPRLFNRFQRGATKTSGKGLGLYIVRSLVERYGGTIRAEDRVPGKPDAGAAIRFTLKKADENVS